MKLYNRIGNERDYCGQLTGKGIRKDPFLGWHAARDGALVNEVLVPL
jgi:hypothetical protein